MIRIMLMINRVSPLVDISFIEALAGVSVCLSVGSSSKTRVVIWQKRILLQKNYLNEHIT